MAKQSGLGDRLYIGGYDLSGDIGSLERIGGGPAVEEMTGINMQAIERQGLLRDGAMTFTAFFNKATARAHPRLSLLPTTDVIASYLRGTTIGAAGAALVAKQIDYSGTRNADGSLRFQVEALANGYGLEWGEQLTAGARSDTTATDGASLDGGAATNFGLQAYLQLEAFTGTSVTVKLQDSADDSAWSDVTGGAFAVVSAARASERIATATNLTVRRYLRVATTGTFSAATFSVIAVRNATAPSF